MTLFESGAKYLIKVNTTEFSFRSNDSDIRWLVHLYVYKYAHTHSLTSSHHTLNFDSFALNFVALILTYSN